LGYDKALALGEGLFNSFFETAFHSDNLSFSYNFDDTYTSELFLLDWPPRKQE